MKTLKIVFFTILIYHPVSAQFDSTVYEYAKTINESDIEKIIYTLASDSMLGRNTAAEGQKRAESYIVDLFKSIGVSPGNGDSYTQEFAVKKGQFSDIILTIDKDTIQSDAIFSVSSVEESELESDAIVFAAYGINSDNYSDYKSIDTKGKSVFILSGEPINKEGKSWVNGKDNSEWGKNLEKKVNAARLAEARVLFIVLDEFENYYNRYEQWINMGPLKLADNQDIITMPIVYISHDKFLEIFNISDKKLKKIKSKISERGQSISIEKEKHLSIDFNEGNDGYKQLVSSNVLGIIPGTDLKNEWVIISAHYDHLGKSGDEVYNGADDNASGTTAVLEIAEAFKKAEKDGFKPRRSILFLLVSGEEKGLLGSKFYSQHPVYPLDKTMVDLNIDMIGRRDEEHKESNNYVYLIGADKLSKELHNLSEHVNATYSQLELDYTFNADDDPNRFYYRSDHYNFAKNNIPVIFYFNGTHEDYHQLTDTADKIELDALQKRAQLVFYTAWYLANKDEMLKLN